MVSRLRCHLSLLWFIAGRRCPLVEAAWSDQLVDRLAITHGSPLGLHRGWSSSGAYGRMFSVLWLQHSKILATELGPSLAFISKFYTQLQHNE